MPDLPVPPRPQGAYVPATVHGTLAFSAGMTPRVNGELVCRGRVGAEIDVAEAGHAAGVATENALAAISTRVGGLDRIAGCLRLAVYVAAVDGFTDYSAVADGASAALARSLDRSAVARCAVGVAGLPGGAPVEVELIVALHEAIPE